MTTPTTGSLFDDDRDQNTFLVQTLAHSRPANKAQQRFHRLVERIEHRRQQLEQWQAYSLRYNQRLVGELEPLQTKFRAAQRQMVLLIDELLTQPARGRRLGRVQRAKLRDLLLALASDLSTGGGDEVLESLQAKYSEAPDTQSECEFLRTLLNEGLGLGIDTDESASSAEELLQRARVELQERTEEEDRRARERQYARGARRGKTAKAEAAQARREEAARAVGQSLREVFRKLVSALHPDREPDEAARRRKTLLMQRVNQAYEAGDLLTLLSLQLEIEQIDAAHLSSLSAQRLAHYNQILTEQLAELESELQRFIQPFVHGLGAGSGLSLTTTDVDRRLSADIVQLRATLRELQQDLVAFRHPDTLRESLRHYELDEPGEGFDDPSELADLDLEELMGLVQPMTRRRRSRR